MRSTKSDFEELTKAFEISDFHKNLIVFEWLNYITLMERLCKRHFVLYNILNSASLICGILVPVAINVIEGERGKLIATALGIISSLSLAFIQSYRFNERWKHFRWIAEQAKIEGSKFLALSEDYQKFASHDIALPLFIEKLNIIKKLQIKDFFTKIAVPFERRSQSPD